MRLLLALTPFLACHAAPARRAASSAHSLTHEPRTNKPHIISILQDDLGYFDTGIYGNLIAEAWSPNITRLAKNGIALTAHYAHWHCSPSRRSFLTGRLPIHHGEGLSDTSPDDRQLSDDIDLRQTWISEKLASAGYATHFL